MKKSLWKGVCEMEQAKSEHRILPQKVDGENRAHHMTTDGNDGSFRMQMVKEDTIMKTVGRGCTVAAIHAGITWRLQTSELASALQFLNQNLQNN